MLVTLILHRTGSTACYCQVLPYYSIRFPDEQRAVEATDPGRVAFVFALFDERLDQLWMPVDRYTREQVGEAVLYLPITLPTDEDG